jgi:DinB superfamily
MEPESLEKLRYPIGKYDPPEMITKSLLQRWISEIERLPVQAESAVKSMNEQQLKTEYREDGWTIQQVVNHLADSHMNGYIRFHWALTENCPLIKGYDEKLWGNMPDGRNAPVEFSIAILKAVHSRWIFLFNNLSESEFEKQLIHPEGNRQLSVKYLTGLYAWHGRHHLAHITELKKRMKW